MSQNSNQSPDEVRNAAKPGPGPSGADPATHPATHPAVEPSGVKGDNPGTAGPGATAVKSTTPENALGHLNPSAPEDANVTPGSTTVK